MLPLVATSQDGLVMDKVAVIAGISEATILVSMVTILFILATQKLVF